MSWEGGNNESSIPPPNQDRFRGRGEEMIHRLYSAAMDHLRRQAPGEAERFANALHDQGMALMAKHDDQVTRREQHPLALGPEIRPSASLCSLPGWKRRMTGLEAAEAAEKEQLYARRRQEREAGVAQRAEERRAEYQQEVKDNRCEVRGDAEVAEERGRAGETCCVLGHGHRA